MEAFLLKERLFGLTVRGCYWVVHILFGIGLLYASLFRIEDSSMKFKCVALGIVILVLGAVEISKFAPNTSAIVHSIISITMLTSLIGMSRVDALVVLAKTVATEATSAASDITNGNWNFGAADAVVDSDQVSSFHGTGNQAASFSGSGRSSTAAPAAPAAPAPAAGTADYRTQPVANNARFWNNFASSNGYVRIRTLTTGAQPSGRQSEKAWCADEPEHSMSTHVKVNCATGYKHQCRSCTK